MARLERKIDLARCQKYPPFFIRPLYGGPDGAALYVCAVYAAVGSRSIARGITAIPVCDQKVPLKVV